MKEARDKRLSLVDVIDIRFWKSKSRGAGNRSVLPRSCGRTALTTEAH